MGTDHGTPEGIMTDISFAMPAEPGFAEDMAEMDRNLRQFLSTAARYVFSGPSELPPEAPDEYRNSEK
jgi:hypothetical protein